MQTITQVKFENAVAKVLKAGFPITRAAVCMALGRGENAIGDEVQALMDKHLTKRAAGVYVA